MQNKQKLKVKRIGNYFFSYSVFGVFLIFLFHYIFMISFIPTGSMENTIHSGDFVFGVRIGNYSIKRYDIMIFSSSDQPERNYVKRVIGLPGETILVQKGNVYANGRKLKDFFLPETMNSIGDGVYYVPKNHYFMLGDNRNHSYDSRFWRSKYVPIESFQAKIYLRLFPLYHFGIIS